VSAVTATATVIPKATLRAQTKCTTLKWLRILSKNLQYFCIIIIKYGFEFNQLKRHIKEHLKEQIDVEREMSSEEIEFYYFM
jgi:hypothetical protein